ncbi:MAG: IS3 family transposase [Nitrospiraceae bacterium]
MGQRRKFTAEYKREAVAMLDARGVTVSQIAADLGIGANILGRWRRELRQEPKQAFVGNGRSRDEELSQLRRELARVTKERDFLPRSGSVLRESIAMKFRMIQQCRDAFPIRLMCRCLRVSASGYYGWATHPPSARAQENGRLVARMRDLHTQHDGVLGSPRMWEELRYAGERCGRHRVARLMRRAGLQGVPQRRRWRTKPSGTPPAGTRNHLERDFTAPAPNTKWVTDITYIRTAEHWLYLCIVLDLYSDVVVGWSMSPRQDRQLVMQAVLMAVWQRPGRTPVILHSDRGCQFTSDEYQQFLAAHHITCSMSAVGSCADNAAAESFFGLLKRERVNRRHYRTRAEARADLFDYIERWHNPRQRRRLAFQRQQQKLLTQVSVETG